jgi:hypothetical protein
MGYADTWELTRNRFDDAVSSLSAEQLNWRLHAGTLTVGEAAMHVAGVEISFISQLLQEDLDEEGQKLRRAATDGVVNEAPFPFTEDEITPQTVKSALDRARAMTSPVINHPPAEIEGRQIKSALGPIIDANGAFARLAYHPGYHQGQAHLIKTAPGFPI